MRRRAKLAVLTAASVLVLGAHEARADPDPAPARVALRHDLRVDGAATAIMVGGLVSWTIVRDDAIPSACRICDGPGTRVNGLDAWFRDALRRPDVTPARSFSDVLSYGVSPVGILTLATLAAADHGALRDAPTDVLLIVEGTMTALVISEAFKPLTLRERPDFHARDPGARLSYAKKDEPYLSFPSGHGGTIVGMTAAAGTIASYRGYRLAPLIWLGGIFLATATSYMRIAADRHYFTDVLGGWAIGALIGGGVPWLFHRPLRSRSGALSFVRDGRIGSQEITRGRLVTLTWSY